MPNMSGFESAFCRSAPWRFATRRLIVPWALQGVRLQGDVLEIGAGSGAMAAEILARFPEIRMTITDFDHTMVTAAANRLAADSRTTIQRADASALPFSQGAFDAVLSFLMLHHTVSWEDVLAEAARVLAPGGTLVGYDLLSSWPAQVLHRLEGAPHRLIDHGQLEPLLKRLPLHDVRVRRGTAGAVVRFSAAKRST
ncbi:methyltransferase family protein [Williamsia limnetica]|uniref:Methyltransferase family protein n=1 Tax=Williamsia limnetica TaxID=882452 RepID=A0A318RS30_WILLI|nr:class I SAM-dependent methyltransferase [Williamsia limnetica]PYE11794.1 methyltransferase family protein [Williamsia limnetica]